MATSTIVTSQPDVACDVCERRLLRGEQPGRVPGRRPAPDRVRAVRAARDARGLAARDRQPAVSMPPLRPRRAQPVRAPACPSGVRQVGPRAAEAQRAARTPTTRRPRARLDEQGRSRMTCSATPRTLRARAEDAPLRWAQAGADPVPARRSPIARPGRAGAVARRRDARRRRLGAGAALEQPSSYAQAIDVFNASELPRRVAGVDARWARPA